MASLAVLSPASPPTRTRTTIRLQELEDDLRRANAAAIAANRQGDAGATGRHYAEVQRLEGLIASIRQQNAADVADRPNVPMRAPMPRPASSRFPTPTRDSALPGRLRPAPAPAPMHRARPAPAPMHRLRPAPAPASMHRLRPAPAPVPQRLRPAPVAPAVRGARSSAVLAQVAAKRAEQARLQKLRTPAARAAFIRLQILTKRIAKHKAELAEALRLATFYRLRKQVLLARTKQNRAKALQEAIRRLLVERAKLWQKHPYLRPTETRAHALRMPSSGGYSPAPGIWVEPGTGDRPLVSSSASQLRSSDPGIYRPASDESEYQSYLSDRGPVSPASAAGNGPEDESSAAEGSESGSAASAAEGASSDTPWYKRPAVVIGLLAALGVGAAVVARGGKGSGSRSSSSSSSSGGTPVRTNPCGCGGGGVRRNPCACGGARTNPRRRRHHSRRRA